MRLIDTHSHLYDEAFDADRDAAFARAVEAGAERLLLPAIDSESHARLFDLCRRHPDRCFPMIGLHPTSINENPRWREELALVERYLAAPPEGIGRWRAVGEIGLDLYWSRDAQAGQTEAFRRQIDLSLHYGLPVAVHVREAWPETLEVMRDYRGRGVRGVFHAFSGTMEIYRALRGLGDFRFGVGGVVTFKKSKVADVVREMDLADIVLETDCPYLTPVPHRGERNESAYVRFVCEKVAELKGLAPEEVAAVTTATAEALFGLESPAERMEPASDDAPSATFPTLPTCSDAPDLPPAQPPYIPTKHKQTTQPMKSSILIIYTGGTIGMKTDAETGALVPFDFSGIYDEFPSLKRLNVDIEVLTMSPVIDSSNVCPDNWLALARLIRDNYARYDGFVVLHGTDTMSYTASAVSFLLENLGKPVVFTGSQIPIGVLRTDGRENLITAIEIAGARRNGLPVVPEVSLYFQNRLFRANRTTKRSAEALNAFRSYNYPPLAEVGVNIAYNLPAIRQPDGNPDEELRIAERLGTGVALIKLFPGIGDPVLRTMLAAPGLRAVVLETFGAGNAPTSEWFIRLLEETVARGIHVVNITQCGGGSVSMELYETGLRLQKTGVLCGYDMTTEAAVTKSMYLLGKELSPDAMRDAMRKSLRGEITI